MFYISLTYSCYLSSWWRTWEQSGIISSFHKGIFYFNKNEISESNVLSQVIKFKKVEKKISPKFEGLQVILFFAFLFFLS